MNFLSRDTPLHCRASVYMGKWDSITVLWLWAFGPGSSAITNAGHLHKWKLLGAIDMALSGVFLIKR